MEYLRIPPEKLYKRFHVNSDDFRATSLDLLVPYIDVSPFANYIQSLEEIRLKNIWNAIVIQWGNVHSAIKEDVSYKKSSYSEQRYSQIHTTISHEQFDNELNKFIANDLMKAVFVLQCITDYVFPR